MRSCGIKVSLLSALLLAGGDVFCQQPQPTEYALKAAFLYNFAKFTEWPPTVFTNPSVPLVFGVLGQSPFGNELDRTLSGKTLDGRELRTRSFRSAAEASTNCHVLFISSSESARLPGILADLSGVSVLTVAEMDGFTESGGMISFVLAEGEAKIRFRINNDAAKKAGLKIRSKLLNLAEPAK